MFMIASLVVALSMSMTIVPHDTLVVRDTLRPPAKGPPPPPSDSAPEPVDPRHPRRAVPEPTDTIGTIARTAATSTPRRKKVVTVEYSDWYNRRLTIHRWASYATLPLFAGNYVTGQQLFEKGNLAPRWAIQAHGPLATSVATLFAVNTMTGGWNLWAGRHDPNGRKWRMAHALLMLGADAGFTSAGLLANQAERSDARRRLHRTVALTSIGMSLVSYTMMLPPFRRD
jgi:hypothetical protein